MSGYAVGHDKRLCSERRATDGRTDVRTYVRSSSWLLKTLSGRRVGVVLGCDVVVQRWNRVLRGRRIKPKLQIRVDSGFLG